MSSKKIFKLLSYSLALIVCVGLAFAVLALGAVLDQPASADYSYTVKSGDSLTKIAQRSNVMVQALVDANKAAYPCLSTNPACLQVGWTLTIPGSGSPSSQNAGSASTYVVQQGDSLAKIAQRSNVTVQALVDANKGTYACLATSQTCLQIGWTLTIPGASAAPVPTPTSVRQTPVPVVANNHDYWETRQAMAAEINRVRAESGLAAYTWVDAIADIAQARAIDQSFRGYAGHVDPVTGQKPYIGMMRGAGYRRSCEIISANGTDFSLEAIPFASVQGWLGSPNHRACVLWNGKEIGIGVAYGNTWGWLAIALVGTK